jgi:hypothetical protein
MREIRLYDRERTPPNWMQIIRPGEFAVFHSDVKSRAITDASGNFTAAGEEMCAIFSTLAEAEQYCQEKVKELPSLRCEIFDSAGKARPPLCIVVNPALEKKLDVSPASARNKLILGSTLCLSSLGFFYLDYRGGGANMMFLFTLIGINLALGGFRVILWGLGVREQVRDQQRRRGEILKSAAQSAFSKEQ